MKPGKFYFTVPKTQPLKLSGTENPLRFRKEVIYLGKFGKRTPTQNIDFEVTEELLQHWANTFLAMSSNGVKVPLAIEHTNDPEKGAGYVVGMSVAKNDKGIPALFADVEFSDAKKAEMSKTTDVSLFSQPDYTDGKLNTYYRPIMHIALTSHPIIPGLEPFQAISLSYLGTNNMDTLRAIAKSLGIADTVPDAELVNAINAAVAELAKAGATPPPVQASTNPPTVPVATATAPVAPPAAPVAPLPVQASAAPASPLALSMGTDARTGKIDGLIREGKITPAVGNGLKAQYCNPNAITLALSGQYNDGFDAMIKNLALNESVVKLGEQTGGQSPQVLSLSDNMNPQHNPMIAEAKRRAEASKR